MTTGPMTPDIEIIYVGFVLGYGGDALHMLDLASGVARRGRKVRIMVPMLDACLPFVQRCQERGIAATRSPLIHADARGTRHSVLHLLRFFHTNRAPILHLHTGDICLPRSVLLALDIVRPPHVFATVHSAYNEMRPGDARARIWAAAVSRRLDKVFCPSRHGSATQQAYGVQPERIKTIYNAVDVERFGSGNPQKAWTALGVRAGTPLIVFSSRIEREKRPLEIIEAFRRIAADFADACLVFVGRGEMEERARAVATSSGVGDRIYFVGYQHNVPDWLAAATVWALPTEVENFSLAVLEALAAGCPILSTMCQGNDEILEPGKNALTVEVGDIDGQARDMRRLLSDRDLRLRLQAAARETAGSFDIEQMVDQYVNCYNNSLNRSRNC